MRSQFFNNSQTKLAIKIVSDESFDENRETFLNVLSDKEKAKIAYNYFNAVIFGNPITTGPELDRAVRGLITQRPADDAEADEEFQDLPTGERTKQLAMSKLDPANKFFDDNAGFMRVNMLRDQGDLLRDLIVALGELTRDDLGSGEQIALSDIIKDQSPAEQPEETEQSLQEQETFKRAPRFQRLLRRIRGNVEAQDIPISKKGIQITKNEIQSIRDLLVELRKLAKRYEENATRTNIDARFDGTKLKELFDERLQQVQRHIARVVAIIAKVMEAEFEKIEAEQQPSETGQETADDTETDERSVGDLGEINPELNTDERPVSGFPNPLRQDRLQEQDARTRKEKVELVKQTYNELLKLFNNSLKVHLNKDSFDLSKSRQTATNMIDIIDDSGIVSFYPRISRFDAATGRVITLNQAYEQMDNLIKGLSRTVANIFLNVRDGQIEVPNMQDTIDKLVDISNAIETYYDVKSMVRSKDEEIINADGETSITDAPTVSQQPRVPDTDQDGTPDSEDNDLDGDGTPNDQDNDMDGDGTPNDQDDDIDGDRIPNDDDPQKILPGPYSTDPDQEFGLPVPGADFNINTSTLLNRLRRPGSNVGTDEIRRLVTEFPPEEFREIMAGNDLIEQNINEYYGALIALMIFMAFEKGYQINEDNGPTPQLAIPPSTAVGDDTLGDEVLLPRSAAQKYAELFKMTTNKRRRPSNTSRIDVVYQALARLRQNINNANIYRAILRNLKDFSALGLEVTDDFFGEDPFTRLQTAISKATEKLTARKINPSKVKEQLIKKLIPIVESMLKDWHG